MGDGPRCTSEYASGAMTVPEAPDGPNPSDPAAGTADEAFWRAFLTKGDPRERRLRNVFRLLPADPRCMLCAAPFAGPGAGVMRLLGKRPSGSNPTMCTSCFDFMSTHHGGAEIETSMLFADVRGSTALGEAMTPAAFRALLDRFYATATKVVFAHEGSIDKFVGDELVAVFYPMLSGPDHPAKAVAAARALLRATGHDRPEGPWLPIGAGVHTGPAWIGAVGDASHTEVTVLGDTVNTTSRLAAVAGAGEVLVSVAAAEAAGLDVGLPRRALELKGKQQPTDVVTLRVDGA